MNKTTLPVYKRTVTALENSMIELNMGKKNVYTNNTNMYNVNR